MNDTHPTSKTTTTDGVLVAIGNTRSAVRRALVIERLSQAIAFGLLAVVVAVVLDRLLRLPPFIRVVELAMLVGGGVAWFVLKVLPAFQFSPSLVEVALWLERGSAAARGKLAAGVDLEQSRATQGLTINPLTSMVIDDARTISQTTTHQRVNQQPAKRAATAASVAIATLVLLLVFAPETSKTALLRLLTPFSDIQWPARTMVEPAMASLVHPRGVALSLRAQSVRGDAADMRVEAEYRLLRDGNGEWRKVLLSAQPDGAFERLVETDGESIEVLFRTEDMETLPIVIRLVPPPVVESARATVTPPPYLSGKVDVRTIELGTGTDRRATVSPPVLTGSTITIDADMRGTSSVPTEPSARALWLAETISIVGVDGAQITPQFAVDGSNQTHWSMSWIANGRGVLELKPRGADGILPSERIAFEIPAIDDAPPTITIVEPTADETVTPAATPLVVAEGRDDFGVKRSWIDVSVTRNDTPSRRVATVEGTQGTSARVETTWRPGGLCWKHHRCI